MFWIVSVAAGPSWQICTTSARRTEWASGEWRRQKTCRIWSKTESPTYRYLQPHLLYANWLCTLSHSYTHTHGVIYTLTSRHKYIVSIYANVFLTHASAHMRFWGHLSHLLVSFAPSITVSISFHKEQVRGVIADCFSSRIWQAGFLLLVSGLVTHTLTHTHMRQNT